MLLCLPVLCNMLRGSNTARVLMLYPAQAIPMLKESIVKAYGKKGEKVVAQNHAAVVSQRLNCSQIC